jgi:hypothetical protein
MFDAASRSTLPSKILRKQAKTLLKEEREKKYPGKETEAQRTRQFSIAPEVWLLKLAGN